MSNLTTKELLEAGVHFGHLTRKWNPKMAPFILMEENGIHLIDLNKTISKLEDAKSAIRNIVKSGKKVLFVATKKQAKELVSEEAKRVNMPFVTERWLGGMLTNWSTVQKRIERLKFLEQQELELNEDLISKKESSSRRKEMDKLKRLFNGIKEMTSLPDAVIFTSQLKDSLAIQECLRLGIPTICIVDTNCNPDLIPYPIPANDDSSSSINFILNYLVNRISLGYKNLEIIK
jgi:small subunit ribosomal protein S2